MVEVVKLDTIPGQHEGRRKRFDRNEVVIEALAILSATEPDEAVRFATQDHFKALDIHNIIKQGAQRRGMKVGVRVSDSWTYVWKKDAG